MEIAEKLHSTSRQANKENIVSSFIYIKWCLVLIVQYAPAAVTSMVSSNATTSSNISNELETLSNGPMSSLFDEVVDGNWPSYTNLVYVPGKDPALSHQPHEVQVVVRKAFDIIGEKIIFQNSFPGLAERAVWHRSALRTACYHIYQGSNSLVEKRYAMLWRRLSDDCTYVQTLSKLVSCCADILISLINKLG
jgi:hypothetical protein